MGKSTGKTILSIAGFFVGAGGWGQSVFGVAGAANASLIGGLYGAALGSSIWNATHQPDQDSTGATFDQIYNSISARDRIPIIYGTRKWGGNKVYHKTSDDKQSLTKDIIWCEGDIEGITDIRANDLLLETVKETKIINVLSITYNGISSSASYTFTDHVLILYENGNAAYFFPCESIGLPEISSSINACTGWSSNSLDNTATGSEINSVSNVNAKNTTTILTKTKTTTVQKGLDGCSVSSHLGADNAYPDTYLTTGSYRGCAWTRFYLKSGDNLSGDPTVTAIIKGKKITDTRTGTYAYSENPSMCVRDYLLSKRYGAGHFIDVSDLDEDSFKEVADYCDALVTTKVPTTLSTADAVNTKILELQRYTSANNISGDELTKVNDEIARLQNSLITIQNSPIEYTLEVTPRYTLNMIINEDKSHLEILSDMLAVFGGFLVYCNGKVSLRCEKASSSCYDFNDNNIIQDTLKHTQYPIDSSPNRYSVTFYDPDNQYTGVKVLVEDTVNQRERSKIINKDVDLKGCTSQSQALRLARMYRDKVLTSQVVITFDTATQAMHLEPGDVITVSHNIYPNGVKTLLFDKIPFRILEIAEENELYSIKAEQYNSSIYNDALGAEIQVKNYVCVDNPFSDDIPNVTDVSVVFDYSVNNLGNIWNQNIAFSYSLKEYSFLRDFIISFSENNTDWFEVSRSTSKTQTLYNVGINTHYYYKIQTRNNVGRLSTGVFGEINTTLSEAIPDVTSFYGYQDGENTCFYWGAVDYPGVLYEIREGSWDNGIVIKTMISGTELTLNSFISSKTFYIKAMSAYGSYSKNAISVTVDALSYNEVFSINELANQGGTFDNVVFKPVVITFDKLKEITGKNMFSQFTTEKYIDYASKYVMELVLDGFISWSSPFGGIFGSLDPDGKQTGSYTTPVYDIGYIVAGDTSTENEFISYIAPFMPVFTDADLKKTISCKIAPYMSYVINKNTTIKLYVRTSVDKGNWSSWINFLPMNFSFRFVQFKYVLETTDIASTPRIYALYEKIIIKQKLYSSSAYVPVNGLLVNYGYTFYRKPSVIITPLGQNVIPELKETDVKLNKFFVRLKDINTGEYVAGQMNWQANGY